MNNRSIIDAQALTPDSTAATDQQQPAARSWRDVLPIHPAADVFPPMTPEELQALGEDIKKNGLGVPVIVWRAEKSAPFQLLDGRNRLDAMEAVGLPVLNTGGTGLDSGIPCNRLSGSIGNPYDFVLSLNLHRRHLTAEDKRKVIADLLKAQPEKSDRQIAEQIGASPTTVGAVRATMESTVQSGQLKRIGKDGRLRKKRVVAPGRAKNIRTMKLGDDTVTKIKGTSLDRADEQNELVVLNRGAAQGECTEIVQDLIDRAVAGENVSAVAVGKAGGVIAQRDDVGPNSTAEVERQRIRDEEREAQRRLEELQRNDRQDQEQHHSDSDGEALGALFLAWDCASEDVRQRFMLRVGLVRDDPDVPSFLRRSAESVS